MNKKKYFLGLISIIIAGISIYFFVNRVNDTRRDYMITDVKIYKDTEAWELAKAVKGEKTKTIERIAKDNPELLNYQEPKYGATLLLWAVGMEKYDSAETLLKCGADPDIATTDEGETPLYIASGYSWIDNEFEKDPKYVKLLLNYGADPNKCYGGAKTSMIESGESPLMNSIGCGIEKTKALVEGGADINYKTNSGRTAAIAALAKFYEPQYAYYLIVEKKAIVNEHFYASEKVRLNGEDPYEKLYPVDSLREWVFDLGSEEYKVKMEIVDEFARQGVNYWETKIPKRSLDKIKKIYPDTWEEYIEKY